MSTYTQIYKLIEERVLTVPGLPTLQLENTQNIGKTNVPFSRLTILPAKPQTLTVGLQGVNMKTGLAQIDLFRPLNEGTEPSNIFADALIAHFPRGTVLTDGTNSVNIQTVWREAGRRVETFHNVSVIVQWTSVG